MEPTRPPRAGKSKVKTGCRTCKIRKVKCDEGRPACKRCTSTGRVCDGYGIWGGGNNPHKLASSTSSDACLVRQTQVPILGSVSSEETLSYFDWFLHRTCVKLPGGFKCGFWRTMLFQSSLTEPAVLHAALALGCVNKRPTVSVGIDTSSLPDKQEQFCLTNYTKSIKYLQRCSLNSKQSLRITLVTCMVYISLELLRGHFQSAQAHYLNGVLVMEEMDLTFKDGQERVQVCPHLDTSDRWITEAFGRLQLQLLLFKHTHTHHIPVVHCYNPWDFKVEFTNILDVWRYLEELMTDIFDVTQRSRQQIHLDSSQIDSLSHPRQRQQKIELGLARWLYAFQGFSKAREGIRTLPEKLYCRLLNSYQVMACIMAATCLKPDDELAFDAHTDKFVRLLRYLTDLWKDMAKHDPPQSPHNQFMDMSKSITDMGWVAPLYYVAIKCRVHRLRLQAIRLLECVSHREGFWDSRVSALVSRKVMEFEEGGFYRGVNLNDDFSIFTHPSSTDLGIPTVPESQRLHELEIELCGSPMDKISIYCRQDWSRHRRLLSEYNVHTRSWKESAIWPC